MAKFVEIHDKVISIESISEVEFVSDDIYSGLFPRGTGGKIDVDYIPFVFAQVELFTGEKLDLEIDLFQPEEDESEENWVKRNRAYINMSWDTLMETLGKVVTVTGFEYKNC